MRMAFWAVIPVAAVSACAPRAASIPEEPPKAVVIVSANAEWKIVEAVYPDVAHEKTPWGDAFVHPFTIDGRKVPVVFFHGGWGKVAAAGSAQYALDRWHPNYVINLGTCGGFDGAIDKHAIVLADRTVIYDIKEAMGDSTQAIADYTVDIDLSWLKPAPSSVRRTLLVSADRDLVPSEIGDLSSRYHAVAGDWESGAIAYTCARNRTRLLILRGVSDLVSRNAGEAYGNEAAFIEGTSTVMRKLLADLPSWLERCP